MLVAITSWTDRSHALRHRWQDDARLLLVAEEINAYSKGRRRATRWRARGDGAQFYHRAKVAAEVARLSGGVEMDSAALRAIVSEEERRSR